MPTNGGARYETLRIGADRLSTGRSTEVRNPYNGSIAGTVPMAGVAEVRRAIEVARAYRPTLSRFERYQIC